MWKPGFMSKIQYNMLIHFWTSTSLCVCVCVCACLCACMHVRVCVFVWLLWLTAWLTEPVKARYEDSLGHWVTPLSLINIITLKIFLSKWSVCEVNEQVCACEVNEQASVCEVNEQASVCEVNEQACVCEVNEQVSWSSKGRLIRT